MSWLRILGLGEGGEQLPEVLLLERRACDVWSRVARRVRAIAVMTSELACGQVGPFHMQPAARPSPGQFVCEKAGHSFEAEATGHFVQNCFGSRIDAQADSYPFPQGTMPK